MPEVIFNGPEGRIEGRYFQSPNKNAPVALVLHPHPLHGGTMNNKVVYNLYKSFIENDFSTLRINFRGVGKSQGKFDNGIGELTDAATALDWLQAQNPQASSFWLGGFSFGSWIALHILMRRPEIEDFIVVAPPVTKFDFSFLSPCPTSGLVLQGDQDSIVSEGAVSNFFKKINGQRNHYIQYEVVPGADHFFRERMDELNEHVDDYIKSKLNSDKIKSIKQDKRRRQAIEDIIL